MVTILPIVLASISFVTIRINKLLFTSKSADLQKIKNEFLVYQSQKLECD